MRYTSIDTEQAKQTTETPQSQTGNTAKSARKGIDWVSVFLVSVILLVGLGIRLQGITWSLPDARHPIATFHPDESINLEAAMTVDIPHGKFDTQFYNYGTFYFYLASFAQTFGRGYGLIPTTLAPPEGKQLSQVEKMQLAAPEMAKLYLAGRLVTAILGTATILVVFLLGKRLYNRAAGLNAAALYAIAPYAVVHAHFFTVDVPATFFVALALLSAAILLEEQSWRSYVFAGVACGLCAATKYNTGLVLIAPLLAHLLNKNPNACPIHRRAHFVVMLITVAVTFLIACPGPIINWPAFWDGTYPGSGVRYELFQHSREGHGPQFEQTGLGWIYHLTVSLPYCLGIPLLLTALAGVVYACIKRRRGDLILLSFFFIYYLATGLSAVRFARYMIPLLPVLCLFAANMVDLLPAIGNLQKSRSTEPSSDAQQPGEIDHKGCLLWIGGQIIAILVIGSTGSYTTGLVNRMSQPDPRDVAADYLNARAPQGASIAFPTTPWFYSPPLSPRFGELPAPKRALSAQEVTRFQLRLPAPDTEWDTSVFTPLPDYIITSNIETIHVVDRLHEPNAVAWMNAIPKNYHVARTLSNGILTTFGDTQVFGMPPDHTIIPEDLLYILPVITIYTKP